MKKMPYATIYTLVCFIITLTSCACNSLDADQPVSSRQQEVLDPGGFIEGPQGIRIHASKNAFIDPIDVKLWDEENLEHIKSLPNELTPVSSNFTMISTVDFDAPDNEWFAASIPIPNNVDPDKLVMAAWIEADEIFDKESGYWATIDGSIKDGRFYANFYSLIDRPVHLVFTVGDWFYKPKLDEPLAESTNSVGTIQQGILPSTSFEVVCEGSHAMNPYECTDTQKDILTKYLRDTVHDFESRELLGRYRFPAPRLKEADDPNFDYKVYLKTYRAPEDSGDNLCSFGPDGRGGRYNGFFKKLTVCIYPELKSPPMFVVKGARWGYKYRLVFDRGTPIEYEVKVGDTNEDVARELADLIAADRDITAPFMSPKALSIGNRIALFYNNSERAVVPTISTQIITPAPSDAAFEIIPFEQQVLWVANHEYFHSLQRAYTRSRSNFYYIEGTANAAARSVGMELLDFYNPSMLQRYLFSSLRKLNVPHFRNNSSADHHHYNGQDFYVFVSNAIGIGIEWIIPMMRNNGGIDEHRHTLGMLDDRGLRFLYSRYARNVFIEKYIALDDASDWWDTPCQPEPTAIDQTSERYKDYEYSTSSPSTTIPMKQYSAGLVEITFPPSYYGQSFLIEAYGDGGSQHTSWMNTTIYKSDYDPGDPIINRPAESCDHGQQPRSRRAVRVDSSNNKFYAFGVATEHDETMHVTIRPAITEVNLNTGQSLSTTSDRTVRARYIAEQEPVAVAWYLDNVEIDTDTLFETTGEIEVEIPPTCTSSAGQIRVEIKDDLGAVASASATLPIRGGVPAKISITDGFLCSGDFYAPLISSPLMVSIESPCVDGSEPTNYNWSIQYPDGVIDTGTGSEALIDRTNLEIGDMVSIEFSSPGLGILGSRNIIMCGLVSCQAESSLCGPSGVITSLPLEVRDLRVLERIMATFDRLISSIFNDIIPGWFPLPTPNLITALADYLPSDVIVGLEALDHALSSSKVADYEKEVTSLRSLVQTMKNEDEAHFLNRMINLSDAYIHHYSTIEDGGAEAWNDLAFINGWDKSDINPLMAARAAIEHSLAVWLNACERNVEFTADGLPPKLDDEELMVRAFEAASLGVPRTLIEEHIVAK